MSILQNYRKRVGRGFDDPRDVHLDDLRRSFDKQLQNSNSSHFVQLTDVDEISVTESTKSAWVMINDIADNDKKALDEKFVLVPYDVEFEIGCYMLWDNFHWVCVHKDHKAVGSFKRFTVRRCNQFFNYIYNDEIHRVPVSIENMTMYSKGLNDHKSGVSIEDAKRMISAGSNPITRKIKIDTRVMITSNTVFRVTHLNDFEFNSIETGSQGLIKLLVVQTRFVPEDDRVNNIAWNEDEAYYDANLDVNYLNEVYDIVGERNVVFGSTQKYECNSNFSKKWELVDEHECCEIKEIKDNYIKLEFHPKSKCIGKSVNLRAVRKDTNSIIDEIKVNIVGL